MKKRGNSAKILFITGTSTGVGKTLLTALLLHHLREAGIRAAAIKPFCSGGTQDVCLLRQIQDRELPESEVSPFYFKEPVAPLVAERIHKEFIRLPEVLAHVRKVAASCEVLLVEGSGGLMVPLGEGYFVADVISSLACGVIVVASNQLGTINHTLLTVKHLQTLKRFAKNGVGDLKVVLMDRSCRDESSISNEAVLRELLAPVPLVKVPFLGRNTCSVGMVKKNGRKIAKTLASIFD